jgi:ABC-type lipoprotein export system ATPase subunit
LELTDAEHRLESPETRATFTVRIKVPLLLRRGDVVAVLGPSGCGKTTLLSLLGLLRAPSHPDRIGTFRLTLGDLPSDSINIKDAWVRRRWGLIEQIRRRHIGFALQSGELVPSLTARENIMVPLWLNGVSGAESSRRADELIAAFQLDRPGVSGGTPLADTRVNRLSGGEYQRVCLARAISHKPAIVFVDEPTAALNRDLAWAALDQLRSLQRGAQSHSATVMITHDEDLAQAFANRVVRMSPVRGEPAGEVTSMGPFIPTGDNFDIDLDRMSETG